MYQHTRLLRRGYFTWERTPTSTEEIGQRLQVCSITWHTYMHIYNRTGAHTAPLGNARQCSRITQRHRHRYFSRTSQNWGKPLHCEARTLRPEPSHNREYAETISQQNSAPKITSYVLGNKNRNRKRRHSTATAPPQGRRHSAIHSVSPLTPAPQRTVYF